MAMTTSGSTAPAPPDPITAEVPDWQDYKGIYLTWLETATDEQIVAEMVDLPIEGQPLSPSEAWRFHECELRRRRPVTKAQQAKTAKKE